MLFTGCTNPAPDAFKLNLNTEWIKRAAIGQRQIVKLEVIDERTVGPAPTGPITGKGESVPIENIEGSIYYAIKSGLEKKGFVVSHADSDRNMTIYIKWIGIHTKKTGLTSETEAAASMKLTATNKSAQFVKDYNFFESKEDFLNPSPAERTFYLNSIVSSNIQNIFDDRELLEFLVR
jgi:uncharacterized lipoprotein YajG